LVLNNLVKKSL